MDMIQLSLPKDIVDLLGSTQRQAAETMKELAVLGLYQESRISADKAAELLGMTLRRFVTLLNRKNIAYFRFDPQFWSNEANAVLVWEQEHA